MEKIWEFFENMDEFVYAADMDSYELIYMNKKAREAYGLHSLEEVYGKKCYQLLQGCIMPCAICNNAQLQPGYFKEWCYYNPLLKKHLELKDTMMYENGRRCRIEIAMDTGRKEWKNNMNFSCQSLEMQVKEGIRIAMQASTPDKSLEVILEYIGKALRGERTYIFEQNGAGGDDNTYEWVTDGVTPEKDNLQNVSPEVCAHWYRSFREGKDIVIDDIENIREEDPLQYENLKRQNIHSIVVIPLYNERKIIGFYGIDNPSCQNLDYAQDMLQILGHFIVSSLKTRNLVRQLEDMSYCDQLTKLGNRFAMDRYMKHIPAEESIGIVYCDITGLKRVNDTEGHEAGDRLILRACESFRKILGKYGLFRIGGDELLALCFQISEDELKEKIEELKKDMEKNSVVMAVGAVWREDNMTSFDSLLIESERLMYEDKAAYYKTSGLDRRR